MLQKIAIPMALTTVFISFGFNVISLLSTCIILILLSYAFGSNWIYVIVHSLPRDLTAGYRYLKIRLFIRKCRNGNKTVPSLFAEQVALHPTKPCFLFEDEVWTFVQVEEYSNRVANYFATQNLKKGDAVALVMENRPEYVCIWLGLSKLGVITALVNSNLKQKSLIHSITTVQSKAVIVGRDMVSVMGEVIDDLQHLPIYMSRYRKEGDGEIGVDLDTELNKSSPLSPIPTQVDFADKLVYIYTSGTTGLPKAAVIKHSRFFMMAVGVKLMVGFHPSDIFYNSLPLYHTAGTCLGVGQALNFGSTVVIRKKFSVSAFWQDCERYKCTVAQYIGEICRYLLSSPPKPSDRQHQVRLMFGNGLRPQIWEEFQNRFNVAQIGEFYGATEGNANIVNIDNQVGAVGFISRLFPFIYPVTLIKIDVDTGEPVRNRKGLCVKCGPGETGEFVGKIIVNDPVRDFHGYADSTASKKKIVNDVFGHGDSYFLSGDLLVMDELGYLYFKDRTGDTFRWKGENVSTSEVEGIISQIAHQKDCVVYGVEVPGTEGRAGMVALPNQGLDIDLEELSAGIENLLPNYARPMFIRMVDRLDTTGTYKLKKVDLQKEGFDPNLVKDKLYFYDSKLKSYTELTKEIYQQLQNQEFRL